MQQYSDTLVVAVAIDRILNSSHDNWWAFLRMHILWHHVALVQAQLYANTSCVNVLTKDKLETILKNKSRQRGESMWCLFWGKDEYSWFPPKSQTTSEPAKDHFRLWTWAVAALTWAEPWVLSTLMSQLDYAQGILFWPPRGSATISILFIYRILQVLLLPALRAIKMSWRSLTC
jgi:hypothetical protein